MNEESFIDLSVDGKIIAQILIAHCMRLRQHRLQRLWQICLYANKIIKVFAYYYKESKTRDYLFEFETGVYILALFVDAKIRSFFLEI